MLVATNFNLTFSPGTPNKFMTKLQELARQSDPDIFVKNENNKLLPLFNHAVNTQSISPTPSTSSNSSCGSNIRHFKKALILQSNLDGGEGNIKETGSDGSLSTETKTEQYTTHHASLSSSMSHRTGSPFDMANLLADKFKQNEMKQPKQEIEDEEEEEEEEEESDDEPGELMIVSESVASNTSISDIKPNLITPTTSTGKMDFSIRSLTSNMTSNHSKYHSDDEESCLLRESSSSLGMKTDNESVKSEEHEMKFEDELKPIFPEHFDFLRPSTSAPHHSATLTPLPATINPTPLSNFSTTSLQIPHMVPTHVGRKPLNGPPCSLKTLVDDNILDPMDGSLTYEIMV